MSKSIKLSNDTYLDSSSIVYNEEELDNILSDILSKIIKNSGTWSDRSHYIRFNNGMGVCFGSQEITMTTSEDNKINGIYYSDYHNIEMAILFKDLNYQVICMQVGGALVWPYGTTNTKQDFFQVHMCSVSPRNAQKIRINYIAWGYTKA